MQIGAEEGQMFIVMDEDTQLICFCASFRDFLEDPVIATDGMFIKPEMVQELREKIRGLMCQEQNTPAPPSTN